MIFVMTEPATLLFTVIYTCILVEPCDSCTIYKCVSLFLVVVVLYCVEWRFLLGCQRSGSTRSSQQLDSHVCNIQLEKAITVLIATSFTEALSLIPPRSCFEPMLQHVGNTLMSTLAISSPVMLLASASNWRKSFSNVHSSLTNEPQQHSLSQCGSAIKNCQHIPTCNLTFCLGLFFCQNEVMQKLQKGYSVNMFFQNVSETLKLAQWNPCSKECTLPPSPPLNPLISGQCLTTRMRLIIHYKRLRNISLMCGLLVLSLLIVCVLLVFTLVYHAELFAHLFSIGLAESLTAA